MSLKPKDFGDAFNRGYLSALKHCYKLIVEQNNNNLVKKIILREASEIDLQQKQKNVRSNDFENWIYCNE